MGICAAAGVVRVVKSVVFLVGATGVLTGCVQAPATPARTASVASGSAAEPAAQTSSNRLPSRESHGPRPILAAAQLQGLKDLSGQDLIVRLGTPDFVRRDPPAEIWQYRNVSCVLDVFLFEEDGGTRVAYVASRDRQNPGVPVNGCTPFAPPSQTAAAPIN